MGFFMYLIPFEFISAEFKPNLIPVTAFLTPSLLVYVPAVLFPGLEWCFFLMQTHRAPTADVTQTVMKAHNKSHFSSLNERSEMQEPFPPTKRPFPFLSFILIFSSNQCSEEQFQVLPLQGTLLSLFSDYFL